MQSVNTGGEASLRALLEASPLPTLVSTLDDEPQIVAVNSRFTTLFGYDLHELTPGTGWWSLAYPDPSYRGKLCSAWSSALRGAAAGERVERVIEARVRCRDGGLRDVEFHLGVHAGRAFALCYDVTARQRSELEAETPQSQELGSLGVLAGGIAHEFNNLLAALRTNAHLARARLPTQSDLHPLLRNMELAIQRAAQLTEQMLAYAGQGLASPETLSLAAVVEEMTKSFEAILSPEARLRMELAPAVVEADARQLHQVILSLVANASDALAGQRGEIVIRTGTRELETAALRSDFAEEALPGGSYAFLEVEDDGCGMSPEIRARIFEPFFSTKLAGRGLGLSAVLGIVRSRRGTVQVRSQPDRGTHVVVLLPRASAPDPALPAPDALLTIPASASAGSVLVVDDDPLVRETLCLALQDAGLRALSASGGREATELFARHTEEIGVVVLDLTMPDMNGWQCLEQLRAIRRDISVILISGYSTAVSIAAQSNPAPSFLRKPFDPDELVREAMRLLQQTCAPS